MAADINKPQTDNNSGFGLPRGEFKPIESTENRKWLRTTLIIAGLVLVIGAGIVFWLFKHQTGHKDVVATSLQAQQETADEQTTEDVTKPNSNEEALAELSELVEDFTTLKHQQEEGQQETPIMVIHAPTGLYYVIVSSYIDIDLAMDYAKKLHAKKGINSKIITPSNGKHFVRLSIAQSKTWKEAKQQADALKEEYGDHVWVMKY